MRGRRMVGIVSRRDLVKVIALADEEIELEVRRLLADLGFQTDDGAVRVASGIVTMRLDYKGTAHRLVESAVLQVAGVLEVRFAERR